MTAVVVPNALIADYLVRRQTVDRGTNAYRAAFLGAQIDTVARALAAAEDSLRRFQEATGMVQPEVPSRPHPLTTPRRPSPTPKYPL